MTKQKNPSECKHEYKDWNHLNWCSKCNEWCICEWLSDTPEEWNIYGNRFSVCARSVEDVEIWKKLELFINWLTRLELDRFPDKSNCRMPWWHRKWCKCKDIQEEILLWEDLSNWTDMWCRIYGYIKWDVKITRVEYLPKSWVTDSDEEWFEKWYKQCIKDYENTPPPPVDSWAMPKEIEKLEDDIEYDELLIAAADKINELIDAFNWLIK